MTPDLALVNRDHLAQQLRAIVSHRGLSKVSAAGNSHFQFNQTETAASPDVRKRIDVINPVEYRMAPKPRKPRYVLRHGLP